MFRLASLASLVLAWGWLGQEAAAQCRSAYHGPPPKATAQPYNHNPRYQPPGGYYGDHYYHGETYYHGDQSYRGDQHGHGEQSYGPMYQPYPSQPGLLNYSPSSGSYHLPPEHLYQTYPKFYGGFHSRHFTNYGIPQGDVGVRGNGIYMTPW